MDKVAMDTIVFNKIEQVWQLKWPPVTHLVLKLVTYRGFQKGDALALSKLLPSLTLHSPPLLPVALVANQ